MPGRRRHFRRAAAVNIEAQKIDDVLANDPINQISHDATDHQSKRELTQRRVRIEMVQRDNLK